jgi:4-hydroxybenzoate polyprenyltransferase
LLVDKPAPAWRDYLAIARLDHWFKNVFVLPGSALAVVLADVAIVDAVVPTLIALLATGLTASANYTINEWLDAESDRHHPLKHTRPGASGRLRPGLVILEYFTLAVAGLALAATLNGQFAVFTAMLLFMGLVYNVPPVRTKDRAFLDVLSESINNPLRLLLGWSALVAGALPPSSILLAYWMGGAFLMAVKRYAEFRFIGDSARAAEYRKSFGHYSEQALLLSSFFYALCAAFFLGIFLIKYRIEFLLSFPFFAWLFVWYLAIGMNPDSAAQRPEKLYQNRGFVAYTFFLVALVIFLFFVDIPVLERLIEKVQFD